MESLGALNIIEELGDPSRRRILLCLLNGPKNVSNIVEETGFKQPNVSNHLARLRDRHIVTATKVGRTVHYALADFMVQQAVQQAITTLEIVRSESDWSNAIQEFAGLATTGNKQACMQLLKSVFVQDVSLEKLYADFLTPVMYLIGQWYQEGRIDVGDEHFASEIMERVMARAALMRPPERVLGRSVLLGCSPDNFHGIGLRMLADCLRVRGWETFYLGVSCPVDAFLKMVRRHTPELALVSCGGPNFEDAVTLIEELSKLKTEFPELKVGVGGPQVALSPEKYLDAGADFYALSLHEFVEKIAPEIEAPVSRTETA